jgi:ribosomal protein S18 acetylase RimI-like enzyme
MPAPSNPRPGPEPDAVDPARLDKARAAEVRIAGGLIIGKAAHDDLVLTARNHVDRLPIGLFPSLGTGFVRRWHRTFLDSPHGVGYVVIDPQAPENGIVGFLMGTTDHAAHTAALLADRRTLATLALTGAAALLCRPRIAWHFARSRARPWARKLLQLRATQPRQSNGSAEQLAVLSAVAVDPDRRGRGIGARLVAQFLEDARLRGATAAELVTTTGSLSAAGFYDRLGWQPGPDRRTRDGDTVRTYRLALRDTRLP